MSPESPYRAVVEQAFQHNRRRLSGDCPCTKCYVRYGEQATEVALAALAEAGFVVLPSVGHIFTQAEADAVRRLNQRYLDSLANEQSQ